VEVSKIPVKCSRRNFLAGILALTLGSISIFDGRRKTAARLKRRTDIAGRKAMFFRKGA